MITYNSILKNLKRFNVDHKEKIVNLTNYETYDDLISDSNNFTGLYDYDITDPYWLISDFDDETWYINVNSREDKEIIWKNIILSDESRLTDKKNSRLLLFLKHLIIAPNHALTNGGSILKNSSIRSNINASIQLINILLTHDNLIKVCNDSLDNINTDFIMSILLRYCNSGYYGAINFQEKLYSFSENLNVSEEFQSYYSFKKKFPHLTNINKKNNVINENMTFLAYKLYCNGYYSTDGSTIKSKKLFNDVFNKCIIDTGSYSRTGVLNYLKLKRQRGTREYLSINDYDDQDGFSQQSLQSIINVINYIPLSSTYSGFNSNIIDSSEITIERLATLHSFKTRNRVFTLPPDFVLKSMKKAFELNISNKFDSSALWNKNLIEPGEPVLLIDLLFDSIIKFHEVTSNLDKNSTKYRKLMKSCDFISHQLKELGFDQFFRPKKNELTVGESQRECKYVVEYYKVLLGSILVLVGALNARRVQEVTSLPSIGNLTPNINPWLEDRKKNASQEDLLEFYLRFFAAKSGIGGEESLLEYTERPTPLIIAKLIYKLQRFNSIIIKKGLMNNNLALFNGVGTLDGIFYPLDKKQYNEYISYFCDYIETVTTIIDGEVYRYYIREHELRRFFAILFFWAYEDKRLDSLRHQLSHTNIEHLYNYISESLPGNIFNTVKANYLSNTLHKLDDSILNKLNNCLINSFGVNSINITTAKLFVKSYYENDILSEDFKINIDHETILNQAEIEGQILYLFDNDIISLEPTFYKKDDENRYYFSLKIKDL
ncbi:site-specific recombinase [Vibrio diazotrophicus]|jgi:hypothetical protein|uniref:Site-specific recombinase n=1 Tax=Vibrio diazotrophicus TaxID=685 RepID=A0A2J8HTE0_VIBDI|nr:site-specific recombinase [Vibrio diazotrophicus]PNI01547.1 site-specific recombinase [Vibrio diazotrophicus]RAS62846.1 hypothetical protein DET48_113122 [Vibrio diazotrophicus]